MTPAESTLQASATVQGSGDLLTFEQAGAWLGLDKQVKMPGEAVRFLCQKRKLRHVKIGKRVYIRRLWLEEFLQRESVAALGE